MNRERAGKLERTKKRTKDAVERLSLWRSTHCENCLLLLKAQILTKRESLEESPKRDVHRSVAT